MIVLSLPSIKFKRVICAQIVLVLAMTLSQLLLGPKVFAENPVSADEFNSMLNSTVQLFKSNKYRQCIELSNRMIAARPTNPNGYRFRGLCYQRFENIPAALEDLTKAMQADPQNIAYDVYMARGECFLESDKIDAALRDFNTCLEKYPHNAYAYNRRSQVYCQLKQYDKALKDADQVIKLMQKSTWGYQNHAMIASEAGQWKQALADYSEEIKLDPTVGRAYTERARVYEKLGQFSLAAKDKKRAQELGKHLLD